MSGTFARLNSMLAAQAALAAVALLMVAFAPPSYGRMLLVPLDGHAIPSALIEARQATPLKPGPIEGSWLVEGRRDALAGLFSTDRILVLAAPQAICGDLAASEEQRA